MPTTATSRDCSRSTTSEPRAFAAQGAQVVVGDIQRERTEAVARDVGGVAVPCDVRDDAMIAAAVARAVSPFGTLDIAIDGGLAAG